MSTQTIKKNIIVGTDSQIQARSATDPAGTIYLSTSEPTYPVTDVKTSTDGTVYTTVLDGSVAKIDLSPYLTSHQTMLYRPISMNGTDILSNTSSSAFNLAAGSNISLTNNPGTGTITINNTGVTIDTAQTITGTKTFTDRHLKIKPSSSTVSSNYRPTLEFDNYDGDEIGSVQFNVGNNQLVFATHEQNEPGIQLALRAYNSSNAYSAKLPLTADKATAIGSGDVTLPLAISMGGTTYTANSGGLITLPGGGSTLYCHTVQTRWQAGGTVRYTMQIISSDPTPFTTTTLDQWFTTHAYATNSSSQDLGTNVFPLLCDYASGSTFRRNFLYKLSDTGAYYEMPNGNTGSQTSTGYYAFAEVKDAVVAL